MQTSSSTAEPRLVDEIWGGLASMLVALPSAIAFGVLVFSAISPELVGQGALVGMIGAAALGLVAPLTGRTPGLITAPCAPAAAILTGLAVTLVGSGVAIERIPGLLALTALISAVLQVIYGLVKGGRLIKYIPYPVVSGYLSGVGLIIALSQLPKLLGLPDDAELLQGLWSPDSWRWPGIVVGGVTMAVMLAGPRLTNRIPAAIMGLAAGICAYFVLAFFMPALMSLQSNPLIIGPIGSSGSFFETVAERFGSLFAIQMEDFRLVAYSAVALSALLSIDTLKTCVVLDALTRNRHDSNRELFGQGIANLAAFGAGGLPGAGTMGPTLVNISSGGKTIRSGVAEGLLVVIAILALLPLIAWVPIGALAGILLVIAFRMFDWHAFGLLRHADTRLDFFVIAAVVIVAVSVGLIAASATGVGLAIILFIRDQIRGSVLRRRASLVDVSSKTHRLESEQEVLGERGDLARVYELQGNLFFGTTDQLFSELEPDLHSCQWMLFDMRRVQSMDYTAARMFKQMQDRLQQRGGQLLFSGMPSSLPNRKDLEEYIIRVGLVGDRGRGISIFETRDEALEWMEDAILAQAGLIVEADDSILDLGEIELFRKLDQPTLEALRACVHQRKVGEGEAVFERGDKGDELFLIRRGIVRIILPLKRGKIHHLATFHRGDYFGEMSFLDKRSRSADAVAKTDCDLYLLSRKEFNGWVSGNTRLGAKIFARIARAVSLRLRQTDKELRAIEDR